MPIDRSRQMAGADFSRASTGVLFPRGVYPPSATCSGGFAEPRVIYHFLFTAAAETLITIAADRKRLGARIGFLAVLHTWNQQVMHHPHLHCLVPAGGISPDGSAMATLPAQVLPSGEGACKDVPWKVSRSRTRGLCPWQASILRKYEHACRPGVVRPLHHALKDDQVGRLREAPAGWARAPSSNTLRGIRTESPSPTVALLSSPTIA